MANTPFDLPMLCKHIGIEGSQEYFEKRGLRRLLAQPKLNGVRGSWRPPDFVTRSGHPILSTPHVVKQLGKAFPTLPCDGELFSPDFTFNEINGAARSHEPTPISMMLSFHIFDFCEEFPQESRIASQVHKGVMTYHARHISHNVVTIPTSIIRPCEIQWRFKNFLDIGFEGIVLRNPDSPYRSGRHVGNVWAIKPVYETEGLFVGFLPSTTELHADTFGSMILKLPSNQQIFTCAGFTEDQRRSLFLSPPPALTPVTVSFGTWSSENPSLRKPLYPRFKCVRWDKV